VSVAAVVLAAGEGSRFGGPKQVLLLPGVLERVRASGLDPIVVVEGAHPLDAVELGDAIRARCAEWARGPGASLRCGLALLGDEVAAAVVILADGPSLSPIAVQRLVERWHAGAGPVVAASYGGHRGHPLVVAREAWAAVPDEGLRTIEPTLVPCDDLGAPGDVDVRADLPG
jgi:nicotine blue oxidoreductase